MAEHTASHVAESEKSVRSTSVLFVLGIGFICKSGKVIVVHDIPTAQQRYEQFSLATHLIKLDAPILHDQVLEAQCSSEALSRFRERLEAAPDGIGARCAI
jgi:hypothetical protein